MGILKSIKQAFDPINTMTPSEIVSSIPTVWFRTPLAIYMGYFADKTTEEGIVDYDAMTSAMAGADVVVYGRSQKSVHEGKPFRFAFELFSGMKEGSEKEKTEDATIALLMGEMIHGGTNISEELAVKSADLGFRSISKPTIEKLFSGSFPPSENVIANIAESKMKEAMAMCS